MKAPIVLMAIVLGTGPLVTSPASAQASASFKLQEHVLNSGGHPDGGSVLASSNFRIRLDALGESVTGPGLASFSWRMDSGFVSAYPPPGEVTQVRFDAGGVTLSWDAESSVGAYELYRGVAPGFLPGYGSCNLSGLTAETAADTDVPSAGVAFFYLVTARNRLSEEGTKGFDSSETERPNPNPCP